MAKELKFQNPTFAQRIKGMLGVDFYRLFHTPLFFIGPCQSRADFLVCKLFSIDKFPVVCYDIFVGFPQRTPQFHKENAQAP